MNKFISDFGNRMLDLLFNNILNQYTFVGVAGFYVQLFHPQHLVEYQTAISSWLVAKKV